MAEIRVQPKPRSRAWLWVLLVLAVVALVAWYLLREGLVTVQQTGALPTGPQAVAALVGVTAGAYALRTPAPEPAPVTRRAAPSRAPRARRG